MTPNPVSSAPCQEPTYSTAANSAKIPPLVGANEQRGLQGYKVTAERTPRRTRSIRWDESIRNFDANLAIEADRTRMERQVGQCWGILSRSEQFLYRRPQVLSHNFSIIARHALAFSI